jgi:hypothetical protein
MQDPNKSFKLCPITVPSRMIAFTIPPLANDRVRFPSNFIGAVGYKTNCASTSCFKIVSTMSQLDSVFLYPRPQRQMQAPFVVVGLRASVRGQTCAQMPLPEVKLYY